LWTNNKMKCWFYAKTQWVLYYWGGELMPSPIQTWLTPRPYRQCSFSCKCSSCRQWFRSTIVGILWLKLTTTVVIVGPWVVHSFVVLYMACEACVTYYFVKPFCYNVIIILISFKQIDVKWLFVVINLW
jgi:hypothetical protein